MNDTADILIPVSAEPESGAAVRCTDLLGHAPATHKKKSRVKYVRGDGYKIISPDGTVSPETYYARKGAQDMIDGTFYSHAYEP